MAQRVRVLRHGNCFDGFASAATFVRFYRECIDDSAKFAHRGLSHGRPIPIDNQVFDADVHAIVDFRYSDSPKLDWWFDHHRSAFVRDQDRTRFDAGEHPRHYWDPTAPSCTGYIARIAKAEFGWDPEPLADLIRWADIIDAARFPDAQTAVSLEAPPLQLMAVCEHLKDGPLADRVATGLSEGRMDELAEDREIQRRFAPIKKRHDRTLTLIEQLAVVHDDVVYVDMIGQKDIVGNKFGPYFLNPDSTYVVVITAWKGRVKLSVGSNPWRSDARRHNIADICQKYGGGGHPVVGGITIPNSTPEEGRRVAAEIIETLRGEGSPQT